VVDRYEDNLDIRHAREVLDEDHYGLEKIKDRISSRRCGS
jgi:ATP-dependent Lon protease